MDPSVGRITKAPTFVWAGYVYERYATRLPASVVAQTRECFHICSEVPSLQNITELH